jgi:hypothetical protein
MQNITNNNQPNNGFFCRNPRSETDSSWRHRQGCRQNNSRDCPIRASFAARVRSDCGSQKVKFVREIAFL